MVRQSPYHNVIARVLSAGGNHADPRHIEAYMRLEHPTLDGLSAAQFDEEVAIAVACVHEDGAVNAEAVAQSYGL